MNRSWMWIGLVLAAGMLALSVQWFATRAPQPRVEISAAPLAAERIADSLEVGAPPEPSGGQREEIEPQAPQITAQAKRSDYQQLDVLGLVIDDLGQPVDDVLVTASTHDQTLQNPRMDAARIHSDGTFRLTGLRLGEWELRASSESGRRSSSLVVGVPPCSPM